MGCMLTNRDASYLFQSMLVKGQYSSLLFIFGKQSSLIKRVSLFNLTVTEGHYVMVIYLKGDTYEQSM